MAVISIKSFSSGELTPSLHSRCDLQRFATGLRTCRNAMVLRHGGVANRPGTELVGICPTNSDFIRLIPFVFNNSQAYVLEFGDAYFRVIQDGGYVSDLELDITNIEAVDAFLPTMRITYTGTDPIDLDWVQLSQMDGEIGTYLNGRAFQINNVNSVANTFDITLDITSYPAYSYYLNPGKVNRIYQVTTPYLAADLFQLKYVQSADVLTIVHPSYEPREIARVSSTSWTIGTVSFAPSISAPSGQSATQNGSTGSTAYSYKITAVKTDTYEESVPSSAANVSNGNATLSTSNNISVSWSAVSGAAEYNVYRSVNGVYGFVGVAVGTSFTDIGYDADTSDTPPVSRNPFSAGDLYPSVVTYYQQRLGFANSNTYPERVWFSRTGFFKNFTISSPIQADDAVTFTLAGRQVNSVKHMIDVGQLVIFSDSGEWVIGGDSAGILRPTDVNPKQQSYDGANDLPPIVISSSALYVQASGSIVRDLSFDYQVDGYRGNDLSIFSAHLLKKYELVDWAYQKTPNSVVWMVRDDGAMVGLTYVREQQVIGWHRHDTDGNIESVCAIPENGETALYMVVDRDGGRFVERMATREIDEDNIVDAIFVDSALVYDGINDTFREFNFRGESGWTTDDLIGLQIQNDDYFTPPDGSKTFRIYGPDGEYVNFTATEYVGDNRINGYVDRDIPESMRYEGDTFYITTSWARTVTTVTGLWHLEGKAVSVFADGNVIANPNNDQYPVYTVSDGQITLDRPYKKIIVGLPYTTDIETLDVDFPDSETILSKKKKISKVRMQLENTRGVFVGGSEPSSDSSFSDLYELKMRDEEEYDDSNVLYTGPEEIIIKPQWNSNGRVFIRQSDPIPMTILSIAPESDLPGGR